ncbi:hypothetical protein U9M48_028225 [Paspalum notatum var. saurae]|uniref:Uncharacterized protein n=1 Tax=Paspalum notatum var. saurae TaxID=547442 RepID=A0AAQ3X0C0_PASNO
MTEVDVGSKSQLAIVVESKVGGVTSDAAVFGSVTLVFSAKYAIHLLLRSASLISTSEASVQDQLKTGKIWLSQENPDQWARPPGLTPRPPSLTKWPKHLIFDLHAPE